MESIQEATEQERQEQHEHAEFNDALLRRLIFLDIDLDKYKDSPQLPVGNIAKSFGTNTVTAKKILDELEVEHATVRRRGGTTDIYPPWASPILEEELGWRRAYLKQPMFLHIKQLAENIGRSVVYTKNLVDECDIPIAYVEAWGQKRSITRYHKRSLLILRERELRYPFDDGRYNLFQLTVFTGEEREWIARRLNEAGIEPEIRRNAMTGKAHVYYSSRSLEIVGNAMRQRPPGAGDWHTALAIETIIGKSHHWVDRRIGRYSHQARLRMDSHRVPRLHYPSAVIEDLQAEVYLINEAPEANGHLSTSEIAKLLGKWEIWVQRRLTRLGETGEVRKDRKGRLNRRFSPEVVELLKQVRDTERSWPEAENYLTFSQLACELQQSDYWLRRRIGRLAIKQRLLKDKNGVIRYHYHPNLIPLIKALYVDDQE